MSGTVADPLSPEFDIKLFEGTPQEETYGFRKPTIKYRIELGYRSADVRRRSFPSLAGSTIVGSDFFLDHEAIGFAKGCAILELYLIRASVNWPFSSTTENGKPVVDFEKFPDDREDTIWQLANAFESEVARFRKRGNPSGSPDGVEAMGGQPNPG